MQTKPVINLAAYSRLDINDDGDGDDNNNNSDELSTHSLESKCSVADFSAYIHDHDLDAGLDEKTPLPCRTAAFGTQSADSRGRCQSSL